MNGHSESCTRKPGEDCYKWHKEVLDYTNGGAFQVVVGLDPSTLDGDTESILVLDADAATGLDGFELNPYGVAASETLIGMPRRMLIPPNATLLGTDGSGVNMVQCCCLEKALAIL